MQCHVTDAVIGPELFSDVHEERISRVATGDEKMGGESGVGCAHGPDVKIVNGFNTRLFCQKRAYGDRINARWNGLQGHGETFASAGSMCPKR